MNLAKIKQKQQQKNTQCVFPQSWQCSETKGALCLRSRFLGCRPRRLQCNAVSPPWGLTCKGLPAPPVTGRGDQKGFSKVCSLSRALQYWAVLPVSLQLLVLVLQQRVRSSNLMCWNRIRQMFTCLVSFGSYFSSYYRSSKLQSFWDKFLSS